MTTMSKPQVNGVTGPPSDVLKHITSYPSVEFSQNVYNAWGKPVLSSPVVQNPYSYIYPYAKKVDQFGDSTLTQLDSNFPALKETDFNGLKQTASSAAHYPFKVAGESADYVLNTYGEEYKKAGGDGVIPAGKAVITTEMRIAAEAMHRVANWLGPKKAEAEAEFKKFLSAADDKTKQAKNATQQKVDEVKN